MSENTNLKCPVCFSSEVASTDSQLIMVNTGEHYMHSVKARDVHSRTICISCGWSGVLRDLIQD